MQVQYKRQGQACGGMCSSATQRRFNMHLTCLFPLIAQMFHTLTDMRQVPYAIQKSPQAMTSQQLPKALPLERFLVRQIPPFYIKHLKCFTFYCTVNLLCAKDVKMLLLPVTVCTH